MTIDAKKSFIINTIFTAFVVLIIYLTVKFALGYLFPFLIGILLSYLMQRPAEFISKKWKINKNICSVFLIAVSFAVIIAMLVLAIFGAINLINAFVNRLSDITDYFSELTFSVKNYFSDKLNRSASAPLSFDGFFDSLAREAASMLSGIAGTAAKNIPRIAVGTLVTVVASFYISKDYSKLKRFFMGLLNKEHQENLLIVKEIITGSILKFLTGYMLLSLLTLAELLLLLRIIGIDNFFVMAFLIAIVDFLPIFGSGTVLIPWAVISALSSQPAKAIMLTIVYVIITIVRNFAEPHIIGEKIGVNPLIMLVTLFVGLRLAGFLGMLALPIAVIVFFKYYERQLKQ